MIKLVSTTPELAAISYITVVWTILVDFSKDCIVGGIGCLRIVLDVTKVCCRDRRERLARLLLVVARHDGVVEMTGVVDVLQQQMAHQAVGVLL